MIKNSLKNILTGFAVLLCAGIVTMRKGEKE